MTNPPIPPPPPPTNRRANADIYDGLRSDFIALALSLSPDEARISVPQAPAWSVRDVVAHVVGIVDDMLSDNLEGIGTDDWTNAQVVKRTGLDLAEICNEWKSLAASFRTLGEANPTIPMRAGADLVTHYHDVLQALGRQGDRDTAAVRMALQRYGPYFCERVEQAGLPTVRVVAGEAVWQSGDDHPAAVLTGTPFEVLRAVSGRRSVAQILAMNWTGNAEPYLAVVSPYGIPDNDVIE